MRKIAIIAASLAALGMGYALAQSVTVPKVVNVGPKDLFNVVVSGGSRVQNAYATAAMLAVPGYKDLTAAIAGTGDPAYTFTGAVVNAYGHSTGTITTANLTTAPSPADGQRNCFWSDHATSTLTWHANTGQSITSHHAAGIANVPNCVTYVSASSSWISSN